MRNRILKAPLAAAIGLLAALAIPAAAQAHTVKATNTCTEARISYTSFGNSGYQVRTQVSVNGTVVSNQTAAPGTVVVSLPVVYNGDVLLIESGWERTPGDSNARAFGPVSGYPTTLTTCGIKPPPPPPVYDCDGNELPPGSTPPPPEQCNPTPPPPGTPPTDTPPATPPADTPPPGDTPPAAPPTTPTGDVLPDQVQSGRASLRGPSGCVKTAFRVRVSGRSIDSVIFYMDGRLVKRDTSGSASARINPKRLGFGRHRVVALVRFTEASGTPSRRLPLTFRRCASQNAQPQFTG